MLYSIKSSTNSRLENVIYSAIGIRMSQKKKQTAISPTRSENYPEWYQQVIKAADLAENSPVRGCMVIKPWGYGIWESIQATLDKKFKETDHENAYFPLFIPLSYLEKEAEHVEGFAKECAVVTHHRLEANGEGGLTPAGKLDEPLVVRPTSEMIIGASYSKWVKSYRDLPILINQWANVVRWEMRTRLFLRTAEFLWQEGHTAHATKDEAIEETYKMVEVYRDFAENYLAMPVVVGKKTENERFPGAVETLSIEAMMQDKKALQAGTSHFLGQNFAKAMDITFTDKDETLKTAYTTSWGVSTRLIGGLIMTHSDDDGLVLPPKVAPKHVVIIPIYKKDSEREEILKACKDLKQCINKLHLEDISLRAFIDDRDIRGGEKTWDNIKKGVPIRVEIGPRDLEKNQLVYCRRDKTPKDKQFVSIDSFKEDLTQILAEMQDSLYQKAVTFREENTKEIDTLEELTEFFKGGDDVGGFAHCPVAVNEITLTKLKEMKLTLRCVPLDSKPIDATCIFSGEKTSERIIVAKSY